MLPHAAAPRQIPPHRAPHGRTARRPFVPRRPHAIYDRDDDIQRRGYLLLLFQAGDGASGRRSQLLGPGRHSAGFGIIPRDHVAEVPFTSRLREPGIPVVGSMIESPHRLRVLPRLHRREGAGVHDIISCALVDPNTGTAQARPSSRRSPPPTTPSPTPSQCAFGTNFTFYSPARLGNRHRLPGRPSPPDREPWHLSSRSPTTSQAPGVFQVAADPTRQSPPTRPSSIR